MSTQDEKTIALPLCGDGGKIISVISIQESFIFQHKSINLALSNDDTGSSDRFLEMGINGRPRHRFQPFQLTTGRNKESLKEINHCSPVQKFRRHHFQQAHEPCAKSGNVVENGLNRETLKSVSLSWTTIPQQTAHFCAFCHFRTTRSGNKDGCLGIVGSDEEISYGRRQIEKVTKCRFRRNRLLTRSLGFNPFPQVNEKKKTFYSFLTDAIRN